MPVPWLQVLRAWTASSRRRSSPDQARWSARGGSSARPGCVSAAVQVVGIQFVDRFQAMRDGLVADTGVDADALGRVRDDRRCADLGEGSTAAAAVAGSAGRGEMVAERPRRTGERSVQPLASTLGQAPASGTCRSSVRARQIRSVSGWATSMPWVKPAATWPGSADACRGPRRSGRRCRHHEGGDVGAWRVHGPARRCWRSGSAPTLTPLTSRDRSTSLTTPLRSPPAKKRSLPGSSPVFGTNAGAWRPRQPVQRGRGRTHRRGWLLAWVSARRPGRDRALGEQARQCS